MVHASGGGSEVDVGNRTISVRYSARIDYQRPLEALFPGATGRILGALSRVEAELPISTLAGVAGVGRTRASAVVRELHRLGVVSRHEVGRTVLVALALENLAGEVIDDLGHLHSRVLQRLTTLAQAMRPSPVSVVLFGSFARGQASPESDIDLLVVRPDGEESDPWESGVSILVRQARAMSGNQVQLIDLSVAELRRRAGGDVEVGRSFWTALRRDAKVLAGQSLDDLLVTVVAER